MVLLLLGQVLKPKKKYDVFVMITNSILFISVSKIWNGEKIIWKLIFLSILLTLNAYAFLKK
mgnify:CR=1 FL=1